MLDLCHLQVGIGDAYLIESQCQAPAFYVGAQLLKVVLPKVVLNSHGE